jgi:hypothetical protein
MWAAYVGGFRAALRRWPLVLALWLVGAAFGAAFALASAAWLDLALEGSLASRTLIHHLDPDVLVDLWYHHREGLRLLAVVAALLAVAHMVLWWWLDGVVVASLRDDRRDPWREGTGLVPVMAGLYGLAIAVSLLWSGAVAGPVWAMVRTTREHPGAYLWYQLGAVALVVWLLGMVGLVAIHDHARLRAGLAGEGAVRAYAWAAAFVLRGGRRALPLALLLQLTAVALLALYELTSLALPIADHVGLTVAMLLGQLFMLVRSAMRVWFFTAQRRIQP